MLPVDELEFRAIVLRAFKAGWNVGLDETTPIDTLFDQWYRLNR